MQLMTREHLKLYAGLFTAWLILLFIYTWNLGSVADWVASWYSWDAQWYEKIWSQGYQADLRALAFPPVYSLVVGSFQWITGFSFGTSALLINVCALFGGATILTEFLSRRYRINNVLLFIFLLSTPTLYYVFMVYSDALFFFSFALALTWMDRTPQKKSTTWILLGPLLMILPWIRITGYALLSWVLTRHRTALLLLLPLAGWLGFNWHLTGDPLHFLHIQKKFAMPSGHFFDGLFYAWEQLSNGLPDEDRHWIWVSASLLPFISLMLLLAATIWFAWRRDWFLAITILAIAIMSRNQLFWRSALRYDLPLYPFIAVPLLTWMNSSSPRLKKGLAVLLFALLLVGGFGLQLYYADIAHNRGWTF